MPDRDEEHVSVALPPCSKCKAQPRTAYSRWCKGCSLTDLAHPCDDPPGECQANAVDGEEICPLGVCRRDPGYAARFAAQPDHVQVMLDWRKNLAANDAKAGQAWKPYRPEREPWEIRTPTGVLLSRHTDQSEAVAEQIRLNERDAGFCYPHRLFHVTEEEDSGQKPA